MNLRNVAIIAHVDHGKTTLVDRLLQQSGTFRENQKVAERAMDSNDLERERGITILAKAASVQWKDIRINIVDTPGHADFGGEVERILNMVDGALVLVDAAEGPLPQTKFVVSKALKVGLKPIVVINKVDRPDARPTEVINEVFDLFAALDASEEQLDFPILYGSAKQGWMADSPDGPKEAGMQPLFDLIVRHVAPPQVEQGPFRMIGTILEANNFLGRIITGRISSGSIKPNQAVKVLGADGKLIEQGRISKILAFRGIERTPLDEAEALRDRDLEGQAKQLVEHARRRLARIVLDRDDRREGARTGAGGAELDRLLAEADPAIRQIGAGILHRQQHGPNLAIVERGEEFERFRAIALRRCVDREQPRLVAAERSGQCLAGGVERAQIMRAVGRRRAAAQAIEQAHPALERAADQGEEQVVGIEPALRQPRAPGRVEPGREGIGERRFELGLDRAAHHMIIDGEARGTDRLQHRVAQPLAIVQLLGVGRLEEQAAQMDDLEQHAVARLDSVIVDVARIGQMPSGGCFARDDLGIARQGR